jgi:Flp pilus assembly protein TadG
MKSLKQITLAKSRPMRRSRRARSDAGAAAVEFALVLPVLLAIIFGTITWGLIFAAQISLNSAARDASRAGVVQPLNLPAMTCSQIAAAARAGAQTVGLITTNIAITVTGPAGTCTSPINGGAVTGSASSTLCTQPSTPNLVQLTVVLAYTAVSPVPFAVPKSIGLSATGAFQCEYT